MRNLKLLWDFLNLSKNLKIFLKFFVYFFSDDETRKVRENPNFDEIRE